MVSRLLPLALVVLGACSRNEPSIPATDLEQARMMDDIEDMIALGDLSDARQALREALDQGLANPRALHMAARLAQADGDHAGAIERYAQAVAASPGWLEPRAGLANAYLRSGRSEAAEQIGVGQSRMAGTTSRPGQRLSAQRTI